MLSRIPATTVSARDWKFHFFPWHEHHEYSVEKPDSIVINKELTSYFDRLETTIGKTLTPGQRAFYAQVEADTAGDMAREYPATPDEAFAAAIEGAYYAGQMSRIDREQRVREVPYDPLLDVETWWDLGMDDETAIWFVQRHGREIRLIDFYAASGEGLAHYAKALRDLSNERGYRYSRHVMPHDVAVRELGTGKTRQEVAETMGIKPIEVAPKMELARRDRGGPQHFEPLLLRRDAHGARRQGAAQVPQGLGREARSLPHHAAAR